MAIDLCDLALNILNKIVLSKHWKWLAKHSMGKNPQTRVAAHPESA